MKPMTKMMLPLFATVLSTAVLAAELATPQVIKTMPPDGRKDVKIHFYIDGHRRNKDANMRKDTSRAYIRAINALRGVLTDRNNPIDEGLRQRGIGKNVEVNTGVAYLLMPDRIAPFSLSKQASESDFGKFGPEESAWDRDVLVKKILENEKSSENIVVCVISNDPSLSTKHGAFHLDVKKGIMFFMLHAPRESVNAGFFQPYWSVEEWASFLRKSMGETANDIANAIIDGYYALSPAEEDGLKALVCSPTDEAITVKKVRSLPRKTMWRSMITHNGEIVSDDEDALTLAPKSGRNRIVARVISPTGVSYARVWDQPPFFYRALDDDGQLYGKIKDTVAQAKSEGVTNAEIRELEILVQNPKKPMMEARLESLAKKADVAQSEVARVGAVREARNAVMEVADGVKALLGVLDDDDELAPQVRTIVERLAALNKGLKDDIQLKIAESLKKEADGLKADLDRIGRAIAERWEREETTEKQESTAVPASVEPPDATDEKIVTEEEADDKTGVEEEKDAMESGEPLRAALRAKVLAMLDDPNNDDDMIENRGDLTAFLGRLGEATSVAELEEIKGDIESWVRLVVDEGGGFGVLGLVFALVVLGAVAFVVKKTLNGKVVATVTFKKSGSDVEESAGARLNKPLRFDEAFECEIDIRATPRRSESGDRLEFMLVSPNKPVWLLRFGNDKKTRVCENPVPFEEDGYQVFDNELAMRPMGEMSFKSIEA